ncbi:MAG: TPM domain-containing protein [Gomphosphaeria aponina SAG 52.96 = DSM 107014]|uniref:TPM domain-containing protein n=1 Tax=Gomphosphaeria aponina SAG 52.96 = DSM 107014 TaxID=1521640 RepID=A0A941GNQ0_9CHRO|nr:TPM domain-containing protein [Gomphosphaeria aponina SAG 52.96 = DSM 107014]
MTRKLFQLLLFAFLSLLLATGLNTAPANATGVYDLPKISSGETTWVVDQGDVLSFATEGKLSKTLQNLAVETGNEVRLVAIRRLNYDDNIESFTEKLFTTWFTTPETQAHQTLLVLDTLTNNSAIRTGEKVKTLLSDEIASSVAQETFQAPLREGAKYNQAFVDASDRLVAILSGQPDPGPPAIKEVNVEGTFTTAEETDDRSATIWVVVLLLVATIIPMATYFFYVGFSN